jgi:hypothetical protein
MFYVQCHGRAAPQAGCWATAASYSGVGREERHHVYGQSTPAEWQTDRIFETRSSGAEDWGIMFVWFVSRYV